MESAEKLGRPLVQDQKIVLRLLFQGFESSIELKRHFAPAIVNGLLKNLPVETFAYPTPSTIFIKANLKSGGRGMIKEFTPGDVFYDVAQDSIGLALKPFRSSIRQLKLGRILGSVELIDKIERITPVRIVRA